MDFGIGIEEIDFLEENGKRGRFGKDEGPTGNTCFLRTGFLAGDISPGGRIFPYSDENKTWDDSLLGQGGSPCGGFAVDLSGEGFSVEDACGHRTTMQRM